MKSLQKALDDDGFALLQQALAEPQRARLLDLVSAERVAGAVRHRKGSAFAVRALLSKVEPLRAALRETGMDAIASAALGHDAFPIDAIYFDKSRAANWAVPGHQDRQLPVEPSSLVECRMRDGISYAEPGVDVLATLLAVRLHFDATDAASGALAMVAGSHRRGIISQVEIRDLPSEAFQACTAQAGDVLLMRPLVVHRSSPTNSLAPRRVLHVVYASAQPTANFRFRT